MRKLLVIVVILLVSFFPKSYYGEERNDPITELKEEIKKKASFDPSNDLRSRYARKKILNEKSKKKKKNEDVIELTYSGDEEPFMYFAEFLLDSPSKNYHAFIETIYYREGIKIKDIYYESEPVKTNKVGLYFTNLKIESESGEKYLYKHVPYLVTDNKPTIYFSDLNFNNDENRITGNINILDTKKAYYIDLYYTDNNEYHYQEVVAKDDGSFEINLSRKGTEETMYLRVSDGFGNYGDACELTRTESLRYGSNEVEFALFSSEEWKKDDQKKKVIQKYIYLSVLLGLGNIVLANGVKIVGLKKENEK